MDKVFFNEDLAFQVNEQASIEKIYISDNFFYVQVDNLYKHPDLIRDLILNTPTTTHPLVNGGFPNSKDSGRICIFLRMDSVINFISNVICQNFKTNRQKNEIQNTMYSSPFMANVMTGTNIETNYPHVDTDKPDHYAATIYFNQDNEIEGGTGFYKIRDSITGNANLDTKYETAELVSKSEMKYNRMIIYPSDWWHRSYLDSNDFINGNYRLSQQFFI